MELAWIAPAIGSPIIYAAVSIGDKLILSRLGIRLTSFYLYVGLSQLVIAVLVLAVKGWPAAEIGTLAEAFGGGFLWGAGLLCMFWVLQREEVSRVMPVWQSSPIFVALLAVLFLDETLLWQHWAAILLVVCGAAAVSLNIGGTKAGAKVPLLRPTFFLLVLGALTIGIAQLLLKDVSDDLSVWHSMAFRGIGLFASLSLPNARPANIVALGKFMGRPGYMAALVAAETIGPFIGNLLLLTAIANGPVSLVSALLGTRPVFVLGLTLALGVLASGLLKERMTGADIAVKTASTAAVVTGIVLIAVA